MWTLAVCLSVCCLAVLAYPNRLDLYEGEVCKQQQGVFWTCKKISQCPKAKEGLKKGRRPQICNFLESEPIVCCEPSPSPIQSASGSKSKQMCKKYGESVFLRLPNPIGEGETMIDTCALIEPLITNGTNAAPREYPHMALIGFGNKNSIRWSCGGSLISDRFVLSAAHCTEAGSNKARWVRLGDYNVRSRKDDDNYDAQSVEYEIVERINHPQYDSSTVYNDIALYRLKTKVEFNEYIRPICLHTEYHLPKQYGIITGWGSVEWGSKRSDILQKANVTFVPGKQCNSEIPKKENLRRGIIDESMLCAGDRLNEKDTCQGDSGGPLQYRLSDPYCMYSQVGITSFGIRCASIYPGVYTRVSHFIPWIESIVWP